LSYNSAIQSGLPLLFNFALKYTTRKVQEKQVGVELNGTHHLLVYADNVYLLGDNIRIDTIKKNTETLIDDNKEVGLEVNTEKTKYMCCLISECRAKFNSFQFFIIYVLSQQL
jgi:hypothetical protein